eukprot:CAMPEP_0118681978 /NCGR_PEP_ID=MMETSP0800-20121206/5238_1 /TAXON_ID=210618 ORGANISM="Striatella unipunctata, Strain CCMP2910" /NCGR_SAMPLE_ID=MMETSP0800 /ASSEMBLY_ACC=CAM_ASM_000638 /LENGTH=262 /DNA_ID=CAMNT_0006578333 /DNA_START=14 /DNA_END=802 /DNA_ORIENTATION=-
MGSKACKFITASLFLVGLLLLINNSNAYVPSSRTNELKSLQMSTTAEMIDTPLIGEKCEAGGTILDEKAVFAKSDFPLTPEELIEKTRYVLRKDSGVLETSLWADDFEFCAPYIGPLTKEQFLDAASGFSIYDAFPDFDNRYFGLTVDPLEPGRVWFFTRLVATHTGKLFGKEPSGEKVELPPQVYSLTFNREGLVKQLTVGYVTDRRQGNTGGLGGMFGVFYKVGQPLPFPESYPYKLSWRFRLFTWLGNKLSNLGKKKED